MTLRTYIYIHTYIHFVVREKAIGTVLYIYLATQFFLVIIEHYKSANYYIQCRVLPFFLMMGAIYEVASNYVN